MDEIVQWGYHGFMAMQPTTAKGRATRERIVRAAAKLVAERGVGGMSLDDVCAEAPASKSQLYHYFSGRDELQQAVAEATCEAVLAVQADVLAGFDSFEGVARYFDATVALQEERQARGGCPIGSLAGQLAEHHEGSRLALASGLEQWEAGFRTGLEAMVGRGDLRRNVDLDVLATQIVAAIQGGLLLTQVRRDPQQMRKAADAAFALLSAAAVEETRAGGTPVRTDASPPTGALGHRGDSGKTSPRPPSTASSTPVT